MHHWRANDHEQKRKTTQSPHVRHRSRRGKDTDQPSAQIPLNDAEKAVWSAPGITKVKNKLEIDREVFAL